MPSGIIRQMEAELAKSKSSGKKLTAQLGRVMSQDRIAKAGPETQALKKGKK